MEKEQLVVIKTEREAKEENWVTEMSEKRNCWDVMSEKEKKRNQGCPKFCCRRDKQEGSSKEGRDYITVLYHDFSKLPKGWQIQ